MNWSNRTWSECQKAAAANGEHRVAWGKNTWSICCAVRRTRLGNVNRCSCGEHEILTTEEHSVPQDATESNRHLILFFREITFRLVFYSIGTWASVAFWVRVKAVGICDVMLSHLLSREPDCSSPIHAFFFFKSPMPAASKPYEWLCVLISMLAEPSGILGALPSPAAKQV